MKLILLTCLFSSLTCCISMREKITAIVPQMPWDGTKIKTNKTLQHHSKPQETVVLLHGLWRSKNAMNKLQDALVEDGYRVVNVGYPSYRKNLNNLSANVTKQISKHVTPDSKVSFITHSLGGIVLRDILKETTPWGVHRVVMLAPPNNGSEIVQALDKAKLAWILGPVNKDLLKESVEKLPNSLPQEIDLGIIMGTDSRLWIFNKILPGESDGVVTVEGGKMKGMKDFKTTKNNHTFIMLDNEVVTASRQFIKTGTFALKENSSK